MDSLTSALRNLESRLAMALDNSRQAQDDLNRVRLQCGLAPVAYFHLSAAVAVEVKAGPKGVVKLSDQDGDETVALMLDAGRAFAVAKSSMWRRRAGKGSAPGRTNADETDQDRRADRAHRAGDR